MAKKASESFVAYKNENGPVITTVERNIIMEGNLYFKDSFKEMDEITEKCFKKIKNLIEMNNEYLNKILDFFPFGDDERYRGEYLLNNTQNAKNWIVGKKIK